LLAYNSWWQKGETTFRLQINTAHQQLGGWHVTFPMHYFPHYWCHVAWVWMNLQKKKLMTNDMTPLLEISLDVHAFTLAQCWQVL
jgi:hypothetical protein